MTSCSQRQTDNQQKGPTSNRYHVQQVPHAVMQARMRWQSYAGEGASRVGRWPSPTNAGTMLKKEPIPSSRSLLHLIRHATHAYTEAWLSVHCDIVPKKYTPSDFCTYSSSVLSSILMITSTQ